MVVSCKTIVTRKGQPMAFIELEDRVAKVEVVLFPDIWKKYGPIVQKGSLLFIRAKLQLGDEEVKLLADLVVTLNDPNLKMKARQRTHAVRIASPSNASNGVADEGSGKLERNGRPPERPSKVTQRVFVKIPADREHPSELTALKRILTKSKGTLPVILYYESSQKMLSLSDAYTVRPSPELFKEIETLLGKDTIKVK
jgi:DNA polymerase-3 subunit alpha